MAKAGWAKFPYADKAYLYEADLLRGDVQLSLNPRALEPQHVAVPPVVELEILLQLLGHPLGVLARLGERLRVGAADADIAHADPRWRAGRILAERDQGAPGRR